MKIKLPLTIVRKMRDEVEEEIAKALQYIQDYNEAGIDLDSILIRLEMLEDQFIVLKEAIQDANKQKHADKNTNNYYIYKLFNINNRIRFFQNLNIDNNDNAYFIDTEINDIIKSLEEEKSKIKTKLTNFNRDTKIKVEIDDDLKLASKKLYTEDK